MKKTLLALALSGACLSLFAVDARAADAPAAVPPATVGEEAQVEQAEAAEAVAEAVKEGGETSVSLEDVQTFVSVFRAVKEAYVEPVDDKTLMQQAIRGLLSGLDPHSEYLDTRSVQVLDEETTGEYAGLGVEVLLIDGALRVISPIDDTPASRAGIKPGDVIQRIDGKPVSEANGRESVELLRGKPGSEIALTIAREGQASPIELTLRREIIKTPSVRVRTLEPGYGYMRISQFQDETGGEVREKLRRLQGQAKSPLKGLVLDLRSNPGGLLHASVEVSDAFLDEGVIVSTKGRTKEAEITLEAAKGDLLEGAPLIVLVDAGTASAAEVVAGALKDHERALIMGSRTFGKGSVQTVLPLDTGFAVKLTTARYYTPSGVSIQAQGIKPDIALSDLKIAPPDTPASVATTEADLPGHLEATQAADEAAEAARDESLDSDYALNEALNVLKGLSLARARSAKKG